MNYRNEQFLRLMQAVEQQGGEHLDEQCKARRYEFTGAHHRPVSLPGCGNSSLFEIPYESEVEGTNAAVIERVRVCAVDDEMGKWPRFAGVMNP